jgi:hypothetical protein
MSVKWILLLSALVGLALGIWTMALLKYLGYLPWA